jgi:hypothetical protein
VSSGTEQLLWRGFWGGVSVALTPRVCVSAGVVFALRRAVVCLCVCGLCQCACVGKCVKAHITCNLPEMRTDRHTHGQQLPVYARRPVVSSGWGQGSSRTTVHGLEGGVAAAWSRHTRPSTAKRRLCSESRHGGMHAARTMGWVCRAPEGPAAALAVQHTPDQSCQQCCSVLLWLLGEGTVQCGGKRAKRHPGVGESAPPPLGKMFSSRFELETFCVLDRCEKPEDQLAAAAAVAQEGPSNLCFVLSTENSDQQAVSRCWELPHDFFCCVGSSRHVVMPCRPTTRSCELGCAGCPLGSSSAQVRPHGCVDLRHLCARGLGRGVGPVGVAESTVAQPLCGPSKQQAIL